MGILYHTSAAFSSRETGGNRGFWEEENKAREELLVFHCAPTLAGIKSGSLFSCGCGGDFAAVLRSVNLRLGPMGLRIIPLRRGEERALVYLYRPAALARDLGREEARSILKGAGYGSRSPEECLRELRRRLSEWEEFPHEIGLFLGYPPEDVRGFIENGGRRCKCAGAWKVYGDVAAARQCFSCYKRCTRVYCRLYCAEGRSLEELAVKS